MSNEKMIMVEIMVDDIVILKKTRVIANSGKMVLIKVFNIWKWVEHIESKPSYFHL